MNDAQKHILNSFPWPSEWKSRQAPLDFSYEIEVNASIEKIWPYLIDFSDLNKRMGLKPMVFESREGKRHGRYIGSWIRQEWEEMLWEWKNQQQITLIRKYQKGLGHYLRHRIIFEVVEPGRIRIINYLGWIPKNFIAGFCLKISMRFYFKLFKSAIQKIEAEIQGDPSSFHSMKQFSKKEKSKLEHPQERLIQKGFPVSLVQRLFTFLLREPPEYLDRIRVKPLARNWKESPLQVLKLFLHATKIGLVSLTWDIICPHCRGTTQSLPHLGEMPSTDHCPACTIDFDTTHPNGLEITFHINPQIREIHPVLYCSADPSKKPHIKLQEGLAPDQEDSLTLELAPSRYRMRIASQQDYHLLDVVEENIEPLIVWNASRSWKKQHFKSRSPLHLKLVNDSEITQTFVLEAHAFDQDALRPSDLFGFQDFRDLFSEQSIATGLKLDIGVQTLMFTDIVGSTALYETRGDAEAFGEVRRHFIKDYEIIKKFNGVIIKSLGDSIMASFSSHLNALQTAVELQFHFQKKQSDPSVHLRISIHSGPCYAVKLDTNIDYFGRSVNLTAKLQKLVTAGQIVFTSAIKEDPEVEDYLKNLSIPIKKIKFKHDALPESMVVFRVEIPTH